MKPRLALHICCAPDEAYAVSLIKDLYDLSCFFSNANIAPDYEYRLRAVEAAKASSIYGVPIEMDDYDPELWETATRPFQEGPEGGERCRECFSLRLRRTAAYAHRSGIPAFGTVMSVSPHKNSTMIDECGRMAAAEHGIEYVPFNFKKQDGFRRSVQLSRELGLYRQNYCGCRLSLAERDARHLLKAKI